MSEIDWVVAAAALAAVAWVNWYFFLARRGAGVAASAAGTGVQSATIVVRGGYDPATVRAKAGVPLRLRFDRQETSGCSEEIVIPAFGVRRFLPAHETTEIEVTPETPGTYEFTCGMSMLRGRLVVEA